MQESDSDSDASEAMVTGEEARAAIIREEWLLVMECWEWCDGGEIGRRRGILTDCFARCRFVGALTSECEPKFLARCGSEFW